MAKPRGKPFTGAGDPRNGPPITEQHGATNSLKAREPASYVAPLEDGASQVLTDLRHAWLNGKQHDRTEGHRSARAFKDKDTRGFVAMMTDLEAAHKKKMRPTVEEQVVAEADEGTARCLSLIEEWLKENGCCPKCNRMKDDPPAAEPCAECGR
jgi:hypothetical protein